MALHVSRTVFPFRFFAAMISNPFMNLSLLIHERLLPPSCCSISAQFSTRIREKRECISKVLYTEALLTDWIPYSNSWQY